MAEVVGLIASVLQLVNTLTKARGYMHDFHDAPKDQQRLLREIRNLQPLVKELDTRIKNNQLEAAGLISGIQELAGLLVEVKGTMERLTRKLDQDGIAKLSSRLAWPLWGKEDVEEGLSTIERFKSLLNAWLGMDIWNSAQDILSTLKDVNEEQRIDQNYVAKSIRDVARNQERYYYSAERDKLIEWFSPLNFFLRQADILGTREPGTGEWLLHDELFKMWKSVPGKTLWCRGMPGAGKTVLASLVVHNLRAIPENRNIGVAVIYLNHQETEVQSVPNLLTGLWRQLVVRKPISSAVRDLYKKHREQRTRSSLEDADSILRSTISEYSNVFIIIDALDEYPEKQRDIFLLCLSSLGPTVNLMLTSRPHININHVGNPEILKIRATEDDIRRHVNAEILRSSRLFRHTENRPGLWKEIETVIVQRSDGMFLLAKLHIDSLTTKHTVKAVRHALANMPGDLDSTYDEVVERINRQSEDDKTLAWRTLSWVTKAKRPLRPSELREALGVEPGTTKFDPDNLLDMDTILSVCAGLVVINEADKRIRLIHYTMQNFLDRIQDRVFPHASTEITTTCITYLSFEVFSQHVHDPMSLFHQFSLLDYAVEYCLLHARGPPESNIKDSIHRFLKNFSESVWWNLWNWKHSYDKRRKSARRLWVAAAFQLNEICGDLIKEDSGAAVLQEAAFEGLIDMVEILINNGVNPDATRTGNKGEYDSALQAASVRGHEEIIRLLLDHGADTDLPGHIGTALQMAAFFGHKESVCLLLSRGANVDMEGGWYGTALIAATFRDNYAIVRILLDHGADVSAKSGRFGTALDVASTAGRPGIHDLLIECGACVDEAFIGTTGSPHSFDGTPSPGSNADTTQHQYFKKAFSATTPMQSPPLLGTDWPVAFTRYVHTSVMGCKLVYRVHPEGEDASLITGVPGAEILIAMLNAPGGHRIELLQYLAPAERAHHRPRPCDVGSVHLAFTVDNIEEMLAALLAAGCVVHGRPHGPPGEELVYLHDFDGVTIELMQQPKRM
ncbi:hypothetical protein DFH09DRAFT_1371675 [Mycena vulgaris]|nr:hypothetical protein DFH09DRAFT_1371675 [Mycena vulgaris]